MRMLEVLVMVVSLVLVMLLVSIMVLPVLVFVILEVVGSVTIFGEMMPLVKILKIVSNFKVFIIWQNIGPSLANFHCWKWPNVEQKLLAIRTFLWWG